MHIDSHTSPLSHRVTLTPAVLQQAFSFLPRQPPTPRWREDREGAQRGGGKPASWHTQCSLAFLCACLRGQQPQGLVPPSLATKVSCPANRVQERNAARKR